MSEQSDEPNAVQAPHRSSGRVYAVLGKLLGSRLAACLAWALLSVALFAIGLRSSMMLVPLFQPQVSDWLQQHLDARISGLRGSWRGITPELHIESMLFEHGSIHHIRVQLDLVRSLFTRTPKIHGLAFENAEVHFPSDFNLPEFLSSPQGDMNLTVMMSDAVSLAGNVVMRVADHADALNLRWVLQSGRAHLGQVHITSQSDARADGGNEGLFIGYDLDRGLLNRHLEGAIWAHGKLRIPQVFAAVLGVSGHIAALDTEIRLTDGRVSALAEVTARHLRLGSYVLERAEVLATGKGTHQLVEGALQAAQLESASAVLDLAGARFSYEQFERWRFSLPDQQIGQLAGFVLAAAQDREAVLARWCRRFAPSGYMSLITGEKVRGRPLVVSAKIEDLATVSWMGSPALGQVDSQLVFASGAARLLLDTANPVMEVDRLFDQPLVGARTRGEIWLRFLPGYVGMRGADLAVRLPEGGQITGDFNYSAPADPVERQISGRLEAAGVAATDSLAWLPKRLSERMKRWLREGVSGGVLARSELILSGYLRRQPPLPTLQMEMWFDLVDGTFTYHPEWPTARALSGRVELRDAQLTGRFEHFEMLAASIANFRFQLPLGATHVNLSDSGQMPAGVFLELLRSTPLAGILPGLDVLAAEGTLGYAMSTRMPLVFHPAELDLALDLDLQGVDMRLSEDAWRGRASNQTPVIAGRALTGALAYRFPGYLVSEGIKGKFMGHDALLTLYTDEVSVEAGEAGVHSDSEQRIAAVLDSSLDVELLQEMFAADLPVSGTSDYIARIEFDPSGRAPPQARVESELLGVHLALPGDLGKRTDQSAPLCVDVWFDEGIAAGETHIALDKRAQAALAWQAGNAAPMRVGGTLVLGDQQWMDTRREACADARRTDTWLDQEHGRMLAPFAADSDSDQGIEVRGRLSELSLTSLQEMDAASGGRSRAQVRLNDFRIDRLRVGGFSLDDVSIGGRIDEQRMELDLFGEHVEGHWHLAGAGPGELYLARLHFQPEPAELSASSGPDELPEIDEPSATGEEDLAGILGNVDLASLPEMDFTVESLKFAAEEYGTWSLGLRQIRDGIKLINLQAESRGLSIRARDDLLWQQLADGSYQTHFVGELVTDDMAHAMSEWGFVPSIEAERAQLNADLRWAGVPWQPQLALLDGDMDISIRRGRFRDLDVGAGLKLVSLLDFNAFIRRLTLDFSDVFGEGVAFDDVQARSRFKDGHMQILTPTKIDGNGGRFEINGDVNLETQELDVQLKATLKISRSLPWLATYMALLGNPITGLSVVVAERVLRDRLEDVSTARYHVTGTISEPEFSLREVEDPEPLPQEIPAPDSAAPAQDISQETSQE